MKRASSQSSSSTPVPAKRSPIRGVDKGFTAESTPSHHYHLGGEKYVVVSDFGDAVNVHVRKFRTDNHGRIFPTKDGVIFSPFVWESLSKEIDKLPLPSGKLQVNVICDTLFLSSAWIEDVPHVSLQRYVTKNDFSRQFLPCVCLLSEREWDRLQCIRKKITESCKSLMFGNLFKKRILLEALTRSPRSNLEMQLSDINMILLTSLTEILSDKIRNRIEEVFVCQGCIENQANQLAHECMTMNYETKYSFYGDLAVLSIDTEVVVKDFIEKNVQMLNYVNETFLNNLDIDFVKNAVEMYIASDTMYKKNILNYFS